MEESENLWIRWMDTVYSQGSFRTPKTAENKVRGTSIFGTWKFWVSEWLSTLISEEHKTK